jgi:hypothetical protein
MESPEWLLTADRHGAAPLARVERWGCGHLAVPLGDRLTAVGIAAFRTMETARSEACSTTRGRSGSSGPRSFLRTPAGNCSARPTLDQLWTAMAAYMVSAPGSSTSTSSTRRRGHSLSGHPRRGPGHADIPLLWSPGTRLWDDRAQRAARCGCRSAGAMPGRRGARRDAVARRALDRRHHPGHLREPDPHPHPARPRRGPAVEAAPRFRADPRRVLRRRPPVQSSL